MRFLLPFPLSYQTPSLITTVVLDRYIPKGYYVDLVNRFISGATEIRKLAQQAREVHPTSEVAEGYEAQAQVCDEMLLLLIPR